MYYDAVEMRIGAAVAVLVLAVTTAGAAGPGHRGPVPRGTIVFNRFFDATHDRGALFTVSLDSGAVRQLTHPPDDALDEEPVWSPNGKMVAFQRTEAGTTDVYIVGLHGHSERRLLRRRAVDESDSPAWSPDGSKLAVGVRQGDREVVEIVSAGGDPLFQVTQRQSQDSRFVDTQPAWSPDGKRLTFVRQTAQPSKDGGQALFIVNANGTHERRVSPWALRAGHHPNWSPNGTRIVFTSNADRAYPDLPSNLYSIRPNGKGLRRLTHASAGQEYLSASYSPDGRWITFAMEPSPAANARVFVMHADGTGRRAVTDPSAWSSAPAWSTRADGRRH